MLDIKFIRDNPDKVKKALHDRNANVDIANLLELDEKRRAAIKEGSDLRARHNQLTEKIPHLEGDERKEMIKQSRLLKEEITESESRLKVIDADFDSLLYKIPNIPLPDVPIGKDERDNKILREVGKRPTFTFVPRDYMEIATGLDLIDTERAAKVSGSRFGYLKREAVLLEMALVQFAFNKLTEEEFIPVIPPVMIKKEMMQGMGYIDSERDSEERYFFEKDDLFLVGTSEQSIVPMHAGEIFDEKQLPLRYVGFSPCFRREAGSYGKDTHGILRVHQFDKVEMVIFAEPGDSFKEHKFMIDIEEMLMQQLGIPYRVVALCTGDISHPSAKTIDIESWLPGQNGGKGEYRETHSSSNTTDYQARRLNIRYRRDPKFKVLYTPPLHILNGTVFAIGRMIIAILENYQQEDGSVRVPEVLQKYIGELKVIKRDYVDA